MIGRILRPLRAALDAVEFWLLYALFLLACALERGDDDFDRWSDL